MENLKVSVTLTVAEWNVIMQSLGAQPFAQVASIINQVKDQAEPQIIAANAVPEQSQEAA